MEIHRCNGENGYRKMIIPSASLDFDLAHMIMIIMTATARTIRMMYHGNVAEMRQRHHENNIIKKYYI